MSELRKQLDQAQADYESARYPGDLASDMKLLRQPSMWRILLPLVPYAVAASVLAAMVWLWPTSPDNKTQLTQHTQHQVTGSGHVTGIFDSNGMAPTTAPSYDIPAVAERPETESIPDAPTFPTDMPTMPTDGLSSFPAAPALPSMDLSTDTSLSEKEPV